MVAKEDDPVLLAWQLFRGKLASVCFVCLANDRRVHHQTGGSPSPYIRNTETEEVNLNPHPIHISWGSAFRGSKHTDPHQVWLEDGDWMSTGMSIKVTNLLASLLVY